MGGWVGGRAGQLGRRGTVPGAVWWWGCAPLAGWLAGWLAEPHTVFTCQPAGWLAGWLCGEVNSCPGSGSLGSRWQREPAPLDCTANHLAGSPSATTTTRRTAPPPPCPSSTPPTWPPPADDFYPSDKASHIPHIAACAYNGLFLSPLALPDWDMCVGLVDASSALCLLSLASHDHCPWEP